MIYRSYEINVGQKIWMWNESLEGPMEYEWNVGSHLNIEPFLDFADTREELLIHMISRQQKIIADAEVEIDRLNGLREVPE